MLGSLDLDADIDLDRLSVFVREFNRARQKATDAILAANQELTARLPEGAREQFAHDLGAFIGKELIERMPKPAIPAATADDSEAQIGATT